MPKRPHPYRLALSAAEGLKPTEVEAAICIASPVFGLRPWRAARFLSSKVPNPIICTLDCFFTPAAMEERTASRASSAERLVASFPSAAWTASINSDLFMAGEVLRMTGVLGKRKSVLNKGFLEIVGLTRWVVLVLHPLVVSKSGHEEIMI